MRQSGSEWNRYEPDNGSWMCGIKWRPDAHGVSPDGTNQKCFFSPYILRRSFFFFYHTGFQQKIWFYAHQENSPERWVFGSGRRNMRCKMKPEATHERDFGKIVKCNSQKAATHKRCSTTSTLLADKVWKKQNYAVPTLHVSITDQHIRWFFISTGGCLTMETTSSMTPHYFTSLLCVIMPISSWRQMCSWDQKGGRKYVDDLPNVCPWSTFLHKPFEAVLSTLQGVCTFLSVCLSFCGQILSVQ